jgi:hypothetical protein
MATVNNWLAFSLSPQELRPSQTESSLMSAAATDDVSGDVCFNIPQGRYAGIIFILIDMCLCTNPHIYQSYDTPHMLIEVCMKSCLFLQIGA